MAIPEPVETLVWAARRRLTAVGLVRRMTAWTGAAAALAAALAAASRYWVIEWADLGVAVLLTGAAGAALVWSLLGRPSPQRAALMVDRRLGGFDRVSTALELGRLPHPSAAESRQLEAASAWAQARRATPVARFLPDRRAAGMSLLSVLVLAALVLVPAATDAALAQRRADRAAIQQEADRLERIAEDSSAEAADRLSALVRELRTAQDLPAALDALGRARQDLAQALDPAALARRTALAGLENSFAQHPLAPGQSAGRQLENLADRIASGDLSGLKDAVDQLRARAADTAGVDQDLSNALAAAADQLTQMAAGTGDAGRAADSLRQAASATDRAAGRAADDQSMANAAGQVADSQQRLAQQGQQGQGRSGQGQSGQSQSGQGQQGQSGQGRPGQSGQGQPGQGQGQGQPGQGQGGQGGQGQGGAGGGGGGGSNGAGGQQGASQGNGSGGGGVIRPGGTGDDDPDVAPERSSIFDPVQSGLGDRERVDLPGSLGQGEVKGLTDGRGGLHNLPLTPYSNRFSEYRDQALASLDSLVIPPSVRDVVRDYFTQLQP